MENLHESLYTESVSDGRYRLPSSELYYRYTLVNHWNRLTDNLMKVTYLHCLRWETVGSLRLAYL